MASFKLRWPGRQPSQPQVGGGKPVPRPPVETLEQMRRRARHRLIGAAVLVLAGVIGFPLLFDTQPRTLSPRGVAVELPNRNTVPPLPLPTILPDTVADSLAAGEEIITSSPPPSALVETETALLAPDELPDEAVSVVSVPQVPVPEAVLVPPSAPSLAAIPPLQPAQQPPVPAATKLPPAAAPSSPATETRSAPKKPVDKPETKMTGADRARALLDNKKPVLPGPERAQAILEQRPLVVAAASPPAALRGGGGYVVQVGVFGNAANAQKVLSQLKAAGIKAYLDEINATQGKRTRVSIGPFASKAEAEKVISGLKGMGLDGVLIAP